VNIGVKHNTDWHITKEYVESNDAKKDSLWCECCKRVSIPREFFNYNYNHSGYLRKLVKLHGHQKIWGTPDPAIETIEEIKRKYEGKEISTYIGLGGGSSMDVCKYLGKLTGIQKILIPTTFGTGAEMTTYAVVSFNHKKKLLQDEAFLADSAVVDPYFLPGTPFNIMRNSACDALAQASEGYDSKLANPFTKLFCKEAFEILEDAIMNDKQELLPYGAMLSGIGFGNSSTTLGHALSYVFSNEGVPHGYALSSCTTVSHKFNKSVYYERFKKICQKLKFEPLTLKQSLDEAAGVIMPDRGHLDNNPIPVTKQDIVNCLDEMVNKNPLQ